MNEESMTLGDLDQLVNGLGKKIGVLLITHYDLQSCKQAGAKIKNLLEAHLICPDQVVIRTGWGHGYTIHRAFEKAPDFYSH